MIREILRDGEYLMDQLDSEHLISKTVVDMYSTMPPMLGVGVIDDQSIPSCPSERRAANTMARSIRNVRIRITTTLG